MRLQEHPEHANDHVAVTYGRATARMEVWSMCDPMSIFNLRFKQCPSPGSCCSRHIGMLCDVGGCRLAQKPLSDEVHLQLRRCHAQQCASPPTGQYTHFP